jgi:DNA polymerase-3 subunit gamma/tau
MAYRALARKYRSQHFGELIGQEVLVRTLSHAIEKNRIHHAYLFTGIRGTGKTSTARILAKAINYAGINGDQNPTTGPTDDCPICQAITADQHPDVIEIDAASNTGVDDVRQIIENARYAPMQARYKVFIIDEVHMLSKNAFNALLKTLEEPPSHVVFLLATTEIRKVPVTILSRCQRFDLRRIEAPVLAAHYKKIAAAENISIDDEAIQIIARAAEGSARDGLSILDQAIAQAEEEHVSTDMLRRMLGQADRDAVAQLLHSLLDNKIQDVLNTVQQLYRHGADPLVLLEDILDGIHLITRIKIKSDVADDVAISPRLRQTAAQLAPKMDLAILSRVWQMLLKAQSEVAQASQPLQTLEMALIRICYGAQLPPLDELSKRITTQETSTSPALPQSSAPPTAPVTQMKIVSSTLAPQIIQPAPE